ncbi:MAG: cob(I)yrinic acid a,c-diamide adenosyltransferase [Bacteroidota bacterium]
MKLYTKTGDQGKTSLLGGKKVLKSSLRIDAYGNVDELNTFIGLLSDQGELMDDLKMELYWIQKNLFTLGSILATEAGASGFNLPEITDAEVTQVEQWIDVHDTKVPPLRNFILPTGHQIVSLAHVCRAVCRRTERSVVTLLTEEEIDPVLIRFLNRLSDYFFIFARVAGVRLGVQEVAWLPNKD